MKKRPNNYWTKELCHKEALKYESRVKFKRESGSAYMAAHREGWIDEICSHMKYVQKPAGYWTKERCQEVALKYKSRNEFKIGCGGGYKAAHREGWIDEICSHMVNSVKPVRSLSKERCQKEALKYKSQEEFWRYSYNAYIVADKKGWMDEISSHMVNDRKSNNFWTKERCQEVAFKYENRAEFRIGSSNAYSIARRNNWLNDICFHME